MLKVYLGNKIIILTDKGNVSLPYVSVAIDSYQTLCDVYSDFEQSDQNELVLIADSFDQLYRWFCQMFVCIPAAGGLVQSPKGYVFIFRRGVWDLPKGKIDDGESIEEAAVREVQEECGLGELKILSQLQTTYHIYQYKGKTILKPTYWFCMESPDCKLTPQYDEDIEIAEWKQSDQLSDVFGNTYPSIRDVLNEGVIVP